MRNVKVLNFALDTRCRRGGVYERLRYPMGDRLVNTGWVCAWFSCAFNSRCACDERFDMESQRTVNRDDLLQGRLFLGVVKADPLTDTFSCSLT